MENSTPISRFDNQETLIFETLDQLHNAILTFCTVTGHDEAKPLAQQVIADIGNLEYPYYGKWETSAPAPFCEADIDAQREADGTFTLNIYSDTAGNQPEVSLAKHLGASIGYLRCTLEREYSASENGRFNIPVAEIERIYLAAGNTIAEAHKFLRNVATQGGSTTRLSSALPSGVLLEDDDIEAKILFANHTIVSNSHKHANPYRNYEYLTQNGYLNGPAIQNSQGHCTPVKMCVQISPHRPPTFDKALENRIRQIGDHIETAWKDARAAQPQPSNTTGKFTPQL